MEGFQFEEYTKENKADSSKNSFNKILIKSGIVSTEKGANIFLITVSLIFILISIYLIGLNFGWFNSINKKSDSSNTLQIPKPIINGN